MKRTPLARRTELRGGGPPRRHTPPRSRPSRRARPDEPLATWCEAQIPDVCSGRAEHRHHRLLRKHGGTDDLSNTTDLCNRCHTHVHANTGWAYSVGLLLHLCPGSGQMAAMDEVGETKCAHCGQTVDLVPEGSGWGGSELATHGWRGARHG